MRVHCARCQRPADLDRLDPLPGGFGFACERCGAVNVLAPAGEAAATGALAAPEADPTRAGPDGRGAGESSPSPPRAAPESAPPGPPDGTVECPKCQHWQPTGERACHRCGLMFAYAATGRARLPGDPLVGHPAADVIRRRWEALAADLDDAEGHHGFITLCAEAELLEYAGACYRRLAARSRQPDERIASYRRRVLEAAMARVGRLEQRVSADTRRLRGLVVMLVAALIVFILAFGYYLLTRYQVTRQFEGRRVAPGAPMADRSPSPGSHRLANGGGPGHHAAMACTLAQRDG